MMEKETGRMPGVSGSPQLGGIDPLQPIPILNLAGVEGVPTPEQLASPSPHIPVHLPDSSMPTLTQPHLQPFDLIEPGVNYGNEWNADPMLPDLSEYHRPYALDIHNLSGDRAGLTVPDPPLDDLVQYDGVPGIEICHDPLAPDPADLQTPQLEPAVHMTTRPGDLSLHALASMHTSPTYIQLDDKSYAQVFMDQAGINNTRSRHFDLLMRGLDAAEEGGTL